MDCEISGAFFERRFMRNPENQQGSRFIQGFLTASLVFCVGPMTVLGAIQDGLSGDYSLLAIKSVLDGIWPAWLLLQQWGLAYYFRSR